MLQNADLLAKIGFDTDENESAKLWQTFAKKELILLQGPDPRHAQRPQSEADARARKSGGGRGQRGER